MEALIPKGATVLQIGKGEVTGKINKCLDHPSRHLVIDPDPELEKERRVSGGKYRVLNRPLEKVSIRELETAYKLTFDFLILTSSPNGEVLKKLPLDQFKFVWCPNLKIPGFYHLGDSIYVNTNRLPFKIRSHKLFYGRPGLFGLLGHITEGKNEVTAEKGTFPLSAHGPSTIVIDAKKEVYIRGWSSITAQECPEMKFYCDEELIGTITEKDQKTPALKVPEGLHLLTVEADNRWCHSIWLINDLSIE